MINKQRIFYKARHELVEDIEMLKDELADMIENNLELSKQVKQYRFDSLTGLKMRADFEEDSKTMFNRGEKFYLVIADVNGLKKAKIEELRRRRLSIVDSTIIALALREKLPILTGDKDLRYVAGKMGVKTIW